MPREILQRVRASVPASERASFDRYLRALHGRPRGRHNSREEPYWLLLPAWLAAGRRTAAEQRVIADFLAGQYCLFLAIRIHDDILDGQHRARSLLLTADRLALDARAFFARHIPLRSAFWGMYDHAVRQTIDAIAEVSVLQHAANPSLNRLARSYARVGRVLVIASVAVCFRYRRAADVPRVLRFADQMAVACQIIDDFRDVREDLRGGRRNYVALAALHGPLRPQYGRSAASRASALLAWAAMAARMIARVQRRLQRSAALLRGLGIADADARLRPYTAAAAGLQEHVFRRARKRARADLRGIRRR